MRYWSSCSILLLAILLGCRPVPEQQKNSGVPKKTLDPKVFQAIQKVQKASDPSQLNRALEHLALLATKNPQLHEISPQEASRPQLLARFATETLGTEHRLIARFVLPLGPGDLGGLENGDQLLSLNQQAVASEQDVVNQVTLTPRGHSIAATIGKAGKVFQTRFTPMPLWAYRGPLPVPRILPNKGKGPKVMVLFSDPACPSCFALHPDVRRAQENLEGLKLVYVPYETEFKDSRMTLRLSACALAKGLDFWEFQEEMYQLGKNLNPRSLGLVAQRWGIPVQAGRACPQDPMVDAWEKAFARLASLYQAGAAPALFVDGKRTEPRRIRILVKDS